MIVGLGNPGKEYEGTRHNLGFMVVDRLKNQFGDQSVDFEFIKKFDGELVKIDDVLLLKPMTFMNKSGVSIIKVVQFYKIKLDDLWVIHDDLDLELGKFKIQKGKGPKRHNGVLSVEMELGTKDFWRVRVGVENRREKKISGEKYVLMRFDEKERQKLMKVVEEIVEEIISRVGPFEGSDH